METRVQEIADGVYRLPTAIPEVPPVGFTFNQFLIEGKEPLLFHTGPRQPVPECRPNAWKLGRPG